MDPQATPCDSPFVKIHCKKCQLWQDSWAYATKSKTIRGSIYRASGIPGAGPSPAQLMIVGEAPGAMEVVHFKNFVGESGVLLTEGIAKTDLSRSDIFIANVFRCKPKDDKLPTQKKILQQCLDACSPFLEQDIAKVSPNVILALGGTALSYLTGLSGVTKYKGQVIWSEKYNCKIIPTWHPSAVLRGRGEKQELFDHIALAVKERSTKTYTPPTKIPTNYLVTDTFEKVIKFLDKLDTVKCFATDIEADGLDWIHGKIRVFSFCWKTGTAVILPITHSGMTPWWTEEQRSYIIDRLRRIFANPDINKVGHNLKFDIKFIETAEKIKVEGVYHDTFLAHYQLDEHASGSRSLDDLAYQYTDMGGYSQPLYDWFDWNYKNGTKIKNDYANAPDELLHPYAGGDVDVTWRSFLKQQKLVVEDGVDRVFYESTMPLMPVLAFMEEKGALIDKDYITNPTTGLDQEYKLELDKFQAKLLSYPEVEKAKTKLQKVSDDKLVSKYNELSDKTKLKYNSNSRNYVAKFSKPVDFNIDSPIQIRTLLFDVLKLPILARTASKLPATDAKVLLQYKGKHPLIDDLLDYRSLEKFWSTYIHNIPDLLDISNRLHSSFNQHVTVTGRLSSSDPNLQNIPKAKKGLADPKKIRRYFIPPPGYSIMEADYKQAEFRCWAIISKDRQMILDVSTPNFDVHTFKASELYQVAEDQVTKSQRRNAKTGTFGTMYGRTALSIALEFGISEEEAQRSIDFTFARYPDGKKWIDEQHRLATELHYVVNPLGRKRRLTGANDFGEEGLRRAVNSPIQSFAFDLTAMALVRIFRRLKSMNALTDCAPINFIHDALVFEVKTDMIPYYAAIIKEEMERPLPILIGVPMEAEFEVGNSNWSEMVPYHLAA